MKNGRRRFEAPSSKLTMVLFPARTIKRSNLKKTTINRINLNMCKNMKSKKKQIRSYTNDDKNDDEDDHCRKQKKAKKLTKNKSKNDNNQPMMGVSLPGEHGFATLRYKRTQTKADTPPLPSFQADCCHFLGGGCTMMAPKPVAGMNSAPVQYGTVVFSTVPY